MDRNRWSWSLAAVLAAVAATACAPGRVVEGIEPETSVEILREIQLTDQAFFPEQEGTLVDVVIESDRLEFVYDGELPDLQVDQVISGVMHGGYLRRITAVGTATVDSDGHYRIAVTTVHADLAELIGDGHFILRFRPGADTFLITEDADVAGTGAPLTGGWSIIPVRLGSGVSCGGGASDSVDIKPTFDMNIDINVEIDIRWSTRWGIPPVRGELHYAKFELIGAVNPGIEVVTSSSSRVFCIWNLVDYARMRGIAVPKREWVTTFFVGPVPVVITHTIAPELRLTVSGSVETGASTLTMDATIGFTAGAEFTSDAGWQPIWLPRREGNVNLSVSEPGTLSVSVGLSGGIGYLGKIYDAAGPGVRLGPTVSATFSVHPDRCEWDAVVTAGIDLTGRAVLEVPIFDTRLAVYSLTESLVSADVATGMGRFPWPQCDEMMPTRPVSPLPPLLGPPPPGPGGDADGDGVLDPPSPGADGDPSPDLHEAELFVPPPRDPPGSCGELSGCTDCNDVAGCGYCDSTSTCMPDAQRSSCPGGTAAWMDGLTECRDCSGYGDCASCLGDAFCGWCGGGGGCMTAEVGGTAPSTCGGGWVYTSTSLCGG